MTADVVELISGEKVVITTGGAGTTRFTSFYYIGQDRWEVQTDAMLPYTDGVGPK